MRILHFNTYEQLGGAAKSAYRLHRALLNAGADSRMLVRQRDSGDETTSVAASEDDLDAQLDLIQGYYIERNKKADTAPFTPSLAGTSLATHPWVEEADLIHLHWVSRLMGLEDLQRIRSKGKRVVWTMHDLWPLTGGCHYSGQCQAFQTECVDCPILERDPCHFVNWCFRLKNWLFSRAVDAVICPSRWMDGMVRLSATFANVPSFIIPYCLDLDIFYPESKESARAQLSLPPDKVLILFCAHASRAPRKGLQALLGALDYIARANQNRAIHVLFAGTNSETIQLDDFPSTRFGFVNDPGRLRTIYSAADFSVHPTWEDNLPNAIIESLSCGTPAIAFRTGGVPDLIKDGVTGFLVEVGDIPALGERILALAADRPLVERLSQNGREFVEDNFRPVKVAQAYLEVYARLLQGERPSWTSESGPSGSLVPLRVLASSLKQYEGERVKDLAGLSNARAALIDGWLAEATELSRHLTAEPGSLSKEFAALRELNGDERAKLDAQAKLVAKIFSLLRSQSQIAGDGRRNLQEQSEGLRLQLADSSRQIEELSRYVEYLKSSSKYERPLRDFLWRISHSSEPR
jgi:glycosyltransferase involved in cell wall biosynthesis